MRTTSLNVVSFAVIWLACADFPARAELMIGNLDQVWTRGGMGNFETVVPGDGYGFVFETGAAPFTLNQVTLEELGGPGSVQLALYTLQGDPAGVHNPSMTLAGGLGYAAIDPRPTQWPGYTSFIDYTPVTSIVLEPNTFYLIAATEPASGNNNTALTFNFNFSYTVSGDWSVDPGVATWAYNPNLSPMNPLSGWNSEISSGSLMIEVDATPVPEPSLYGMLGACALTLLGFRRKCLWKFCSAD